MPEHRRFPRVVSGAARRREGARELILRSLGSHEMDEERERDEEVESAEGDEGSKLSEKLPGKLSGEGETPLGGTDEHSNAPGPHGTD